MSHIIGKSLPISSNSVNPPSDCSNDVRSASENSPKGGLVTNTKLSSPYDGLNALESAIYGRFESFESRKKKYVLQTITKHILNTSSDAVYVEIWTKGTHRKHKSKSGVYIENTISPTHLYVLDNTGFDAYVTLNRVRNGSYLFDEVSQRYRKAMNWENPTHHKVSTKFYRCGACQQLSTAFRPDRIIGGDLDSADRSYLDEHTSNAKIMIESKPDELYKSYISGLVNCKSVHLCPHCQPVIADLKAKEANTCIYEHYKTGGYVVFVTWTARHKKDFDLSHTLVGLLDAIRSVRTGKAWQSFKERHGLVHYIDGLEYTYTESNGHHPHKHTVMLFNKKPDLVRIKNDIFDRYKARFKKLKGFQVPTFKRGLDLRISATDKQIHEFFAVNEDHKHGDALPAEILSQMDRVAKYVVKGLDIEKNLEESISEDWNLGTEITHQYIKKSIYKTENSIGYTAVGLLLKYYFAVTILKDNGISKDERIKYLKQKNRFKLLFTDYALCFRGRSQVYFSKQLKTDFDVDSKVFDMLAVENEDRVEVAIGGLSNDDLRIIAKHKLKARLLLISEQAYQFCLSNKNIHNPEERTFQAITDYLLKFKNEKSNMSNFGD